MQYNLTYRQKDKGWQVIVSFKQDGKWKQRSKQGFPSKKEAKEAADLILESLKDESDLSNDVSMLNVTLKSFMDVFIDDMRGKLRASSIGLYRSTFRTFEPLYNEKLRDVTPPMVSSCLFSTKLADSSRKMYLARVSRVFVYARKFYGIIKTNPCDSVVVKSGPLLRARVLEPDELENLLTELKNYNSQAYLGVCISAYTGLRLGEVCGLKWSDYDTDGQIISVKRQMLSWDGGDGLITQPKTKTSVRSVPVPPRLRDVLRSYPHHDGMIFTRSDRDVMSKAVSELSKVTFHALRHTYATTLIANGVDIKTVAALLGDKMETVMKTYVHYTDDMRKSAADAVGKIFK